MFTVSTRQQGATFYQPYQTIEFSGGELGVVLKDTPYGLHYTDYHIFAHLTNSAKILELVMLVDALRRAGAKNLTLSMPYIPYARQDRVMNMGESLSVKSFASIINLCKFDTIEVWDAHSDVSLAVFDANVINYGPETFVELIPIDIRKAIVVAPDAGANKKVGKVARGFGFDMVRADKVRDTKTGAITGTVVYSEPVGDRDFLIIDDICDGGRTFTELAKQLRLLTTGKVYLYVTHGIFSKGLDVFNDIDHIFCPMPFPAVDLNHPKFTKIINFGDVRS